MIDIHLVLSTITRIAHPVAPLLLNQAQRHETVIKILKELKLDPVQPPKDIDGVYAYALVEYGVVKIEPILKLLREKEIKNAFWVAYTANNSLGFLNKVEQFLEGDILGDEIRRANIEVRLELEEFGKAFISVAQRTRSSEFQPYPDWDLDDCPGEFKALIKEKTRVFCGRRFVFKAIEKFLKKNTSGYFTVVGDAGMGKSAIAAKYVYARKSLCYFNIRAEGRNRPESFLESLRKQLIKRYQLQTVEKADLPTLLEQASKKLTSGERLVIVVDALDEVEQEPGDNLLYLPTTLPERVYFLLTRRPYSRENKRLSVSPGVPVEELDLTTNQYVDFSRDDVKEYIQLFLNNDPDYKDGLKKWIQDRSLAPNIFIEQVAAKSENNFMYLRYILPSVARGFYNDLTLTQLPDGLQDYYQVHWMRMGMDNRPQEAKVLILFIMVEIGTAIPCEMITAIAQQDELEVQNVLNVWIEYLKRQELQGEACYSFYHASFLDFLKAKRELKPTRKLFQEVNQRIAEYLEGEMA